MTTLFNKLKSRLDARAVMVDHAIWAHRCTYIAFSDHEGRRALWVPIVFALLAALALFALSIAAPERKRLLTALIRLLEELGASEFDTIVMKHAVCIITIVARWNLFVPWLCSPSLLRSLTTTLWVLSRCRLLAPWRLSFASLLPLTALLLLCASVASGRGRRCMPVVHRPAMGWSHGGRVHGLRPMRAHVMGGGSMVGWPAMGSLVAWGGVMRGRAAIAHGVLRGVPWCRMMSASLASMRRCSMWRLMRSPMSRPPAMPSAAIGISGLLRGAIRLLVVAWRLIDGLLRFIRRVLRVAAWRWRG